MSVKTGFWYKNGPVTTAIPWKRPSRKAFAAWFTDFLAISGLDGYDVWLCGGFLQQKWPTWDVDIVLTGPFDAFALERILTEGLQLAVNKHELLVDLQHQSEPPTWPVHPADVRIIRKTVLSPVIEKNGDLLTDWRNEPSLTQIGTHLWQVDREVPDGVQIARVQAGLTYDIPPKLLHRALR
ncbi:MAG TPA: hypothetical protein PKL83_06325 [bacterium]|nr:hypothetical protein [bacterium]